MANYTVTTDKISTPALTLAAGAEDTVTFTGRLVGKPTVVIHAATAAVWVTADDNPANPANGYARPLLNGMTGQLAPPEGDDATTIRVYSTAAATYSVER